MEWRTQKILRYWTEAVGEGERHRWYKISVD